MIWWLKSSAVEPGKRLTLTRRPCPHKSSSTIPFNTELPTIIVVQIGYWLLFTDSSFSPASLQTLCLYLWYSSFFFFLNSLSCSSIEAFVVVFLISPFLFSQISFERRFDLLSWLCYLWSYLGTFTLWVTKLELMLPFSFLLLLSSFEKLYCLSSWICYCSFDLGSVSQSATVFEDVVKSFSKLIMGTGWISRLSLPNFLISSRNVLIVLILQYNSAFKT